MINILLPRTVRAMSGDAGISTKEDLELAPPTFFATALSLYCSKVRIMLRHKRIKFEEKEPAGGYGSIHWRKRIPAGNLPVLEHKGLTISDSEVIAEYLEEVWPEESMLAETPLLRALIRQRGRFHDTRLEPSLRSLFGWLKSAHSSGNVFSESSVEKKLDLIQQRLNQLAQLLQIEQQQLYKGRLWLGDCGFAASFPWIEIIERKAKHTFVWPEQVLQYRHQIETFQAVVEEYADYKQAITSWIENNI